jgi:hypothetical protein
MQSEIQAAEWEKIALCWAVLGYSEAKANSWRGDGCTVESEVSRMEAKRSACQVWFGWSLPCSRESQVRFW